MLRFAVAGSPLSTSPPGGTVEGLKRAHELGITAMEIEWVQNVPRSVERMEEIARTAKDFDIALTVHAPYYVNLATTDCRKLLASKKRILAALTMGQLAGVRSVCIHAAFYQGAPAEETFDRVRRAVEDILKHKERFFPSVNLALETMGKPSQFGTLEEVLLISKEFGLYPCIDPAHLHARTNGAVNSTEEWNEMFDAYCAHLGTGALRQMHLHYSGIAYGEKGERRHLPLRQSDARWNDFLKVLKDRKIGGICVCESPLLEQDTLLLKRAYEKL